MTDEEFGARVRAAREAHHDAPTLETVAGDLRRDYGIKRVSASWLSRIEGGAGPSDKLRAALERYFDLPHVEARERTTDPLLEAINRQTAAIEALIVEIRRDRDVQDQALARLIERLTDPGPEQGGGSRERHARHGSEG
jgi:hypothetical protein